VGLAEESVGDNTNAPEVDLQAVGLAEENLGSGVAKRTGHRGDLLVRRVEQLGNAKVGNGEVRVGFACLVQNVLRLEVAMHNVVLVEVGGGLENLTVEGVSQGIHTGAADGGDVG
jgi:hypothetical protein